MSERSLTCRPARRLLPACCLIVAAHLASPAWAQEAPIKPGLWEVQTRGGPFDAMREQMKQQLQKMPPAQRAEMEKRLGGIAGDGPQRVCLTADMIKQGRAGDKQPEGCDVKTTWRGRTAVSDYTCKSGASGHGEFTYPDAESYSGWMEMKDPRAGQRPMPRMEMSGRWLAADCGEVAPRR